jgi:RNA polymerase sigma-70 factor (ECF subfamily)
VGGKQISIRIVPPPDTKDVTAHLPELVRLDAEEVSKWFADEVRPHDRALRGYLRQSFPGVRDVEDVVQESYLRLWRTRTVQPIRSVRAFLFTVARRLALNVVDRQKNAATMSVGDLAALPVLDHGPGTAELVSREETFAALVEALASLPPRCREITILRKLRGIPQREVATRLGLSEKTVEEQVARGVRRCEAFLRRRGINQFEGP